MHSGPSGTPSKPFAPDLSLKDLADSRLSHYSMPESDGCQSKPRSRNPQWNRQKRQGQERTYPQTAQITQRLGVRNLFVSWW